jgi:hypothetical protein
MDEQRSLRATVRELTDQTASLEISGQTLQWPRTALPANLNEGDTVIIAVQSEAEATMEHHERARAILSEILGEGS